MRTFDPVRLGLYEADVWVAYYRREWAKFLTSAVGLVRVGFALPWPASIRAAWYVLRANQAWAPFPDNDAAGALALMRKFYALVKRHHLEPFDVDTAAGWRSTGGARTASCSTATATRRPASTR